MRINIKYVKNFFNHICMHWPRYLFSLILIVIELRLIFMSDSNITFSVSALFFLSISISVHSKKYLIIRYAFATVGLVTFILSLKLLNIDFATVTTFIFYIPMMYAFLLSDVFSTLIVGVILSYLLSTYMGGFIPDNTIIGTMISMMNASISYTAISYLIRRLRSANSKLQDLNSELKQLSIIDGLTGIYNRRFFDLELARECRNATHSAKPLSLIMLDIDFFKAYNDSYGHQEGDKCLTLIAATLNKTIRKPGDIVFRYGGEEFAVILSETDAEGAKIVAENLRCEVENLKIPHIGSKVSNIVTVSVGVSTIVPNPYLIPDKLVSFSDKALYQAKKDGRNTIKYYIE